MCDTLMHAKKNLMARKGCWRLHYGGSINPTTTVFVSQMDHTEREAGTADLASSVQRHSSSGRVCEGVSHLPREGIGQWTPSNLAPHFRGGRICTTVDSL